MGAERWCQWWRTLCAEALSYLQPFLPSKWHLTDSLYPLNMGKSGENNQLSKMVWNLSMKILPLNTPEKRWKHLLAHYLIWGSNGYPQRTGEGKRWPYSFFEAPRARHHRLNFVSPSAISIAQTDRKADKALGLGLKLKEFLRFRDRGLHYKNRLLDLEMSAQDPNLQFRGIANGAEESTSLTVFMAHWSITTNWMRGTSQGFQRPSNWFTPMLNTDSFREISLSLYQHSTWCTKTGLVKLA